MDLNSSRRAARCPFRVVVLLALCLLPAMQNPASATESIPDGSATASADSPATAGMTFVTVTIHGQVSSAFTAENPSTVVAQEWVHWMQARLDLRTTSINDARTSAGLPLIERVGVEGDWAKMTWYGARYVLAGRVLDLIAPYVDSVEGDAMGDTTRETAADFLALGKMQTGNMSRLAARQFADETFRAVQPRLAAHPEIPIFVDVVGHSRGGAVSSEFARRFNTQLAASRLVAPASLSEPDSASASDSAAFAAIPPLPPPPRVSVTYLDGIDPTPSGKSTLAGNLLGDPTISRAGGERISSFHGEKAFDADKDDVSFFGAGFAEWLDSVGLTTTDEDLVDLGYPKGRSRPELFPNAAPFANINRMIDGATHLSIEKDYTSMDDVKVGQAPESDFSFSATTALGELIQDPLQPLPRESAHAASLWPTVDVLFDSPGPVSAEFLASPSESGATTQTLDATAEFVRDGNFSQSSSIVQNSDTLMSSAWVVFFIPDAVGGIEALLQDIDDEDFPFAGVWERSGTSNKILQLDDIPFARLFADDVLSQDLSVESLDFGRFRVAVEFEFATASGELTASLAGDRLMAFDSALGADLGTGTRHTLEFVARRDFVAPGPPVFDSMNLLGLDVDVYSVSVIPAPLSPDVVGYIMAVPVSVEDPLNINGDGAVDVADVIRARNLGL